MILSNAFGVSAGVIALLNSIFVMFIFRTYGYECTLLICLILFIVYDGVVALLPTASQTVLGDVVPQVKALPGSKKEKQTSQANCLRLAVCLDSPLYDNHLFQKGKHEKCVECARKGKAMLYNAKRKGCDSSTSTSDAKTCYDCHPTATPDDEYCNTAQYCADVKRALTMMRDMSSVEHGSHASICRESKGSLCWFECINGDCSGQLKGFTGDSITGVDDPTGSGRGFPTESVCVKQTGGRCVKIKNCVGYEDQFKTCSCDTYKSSSKMRDPCERFEKTCDKNSILFQEARARVAQSNIKVRDIVSAEDGKNIVSALDRAVEMIP